LLASFSLEYVVNICWLFQTLSIWDNLIERANYSHYWTLHYSSFVGYEPEKVVSEPKLKVFVVPFSHVDPGEF